MRCVVLETPEVAAYYLTPPSATQAILARVGTHEAAVP